MRDKCDICGEYKMCNDDSECFDCVQDRYDLEEWLPEDDDESDDYGARPRVNLDEDEVE